MNRLLSRCLTWVNDVWSLVIRLVATRLPVPV